MAYYLNSVTKTRLTKLQEWSLFGVLLTIPLFRLGTELLGTQSLTPAKIFLGITVLLWTVNILRSKDTTSILILIREKANILVLVFLAITFISLINARYLEDETVMEISVRVKMLVLYFIIIAIIKDRKTFKIALFTLIIGSLITAGVGLYETFTGNAFFEESFRLADFTQKKEGLLTTAYSGKGRAQGLYSDAGFHAHAMVIFFGLAVPWIFYARSGKMKILTSILVTCYVVNVIGTGARVGWVSLGCAFFMFLCLFKHRFKYSLWVISFTLLIVIFLASSLIPFIPTFERFHLKGDWSWSWRKDTYRQSIEMVRDHPFLGVGTGNYLTEYHNYLSVRPRLSRQTFGWLHNSYFQIWAENGTIGLFVFIFFFLSIFLGLLTVYLKAADPEMKTLAVSLLTAFTGYAVEFAGVPILGQELGWVVLGLAVALLAIERKEREEILTTK